MCSTLSSTCPKETHIGSKATSNNTSHSLSTLFLSIQAEHQPWATLAAVCIQSSAAAAAAAAEDKELSMEQKTRMGARSNLQVEEDRNFSLLHFCHQRYTGDWQKLQHPSIALLQNKNKNSRGLGNSKNSQCATTTTIQQDACMPSLTQQFRLEEDFTIRTVRYLLLLDTCCCTKRLTRLSKLCGRSIIIIIIISIIVPEEKVPSLCVVWGGGGANLKEQQAVLFFSDLCRLWIPAGQTPSSAIAIFFSCSLSCEWTQDAREEGRRQRRWWCLL